MNEWRYSTAIVEAMIDLGGGAFVRLSDIVGVQATDKGGCRVHLRHGGEYYGTATAKEICEDMVAAWKYRGE